MSLLELRFGDNDTLSALVASLIEADWLFLLTDVDALYTADPRRDQSAHPIRVVQRLDELKADVAPPPKQTTPSVTAALPSASGMWGTGGMATKIQVSLFRTIETPDRLSIQYSGDRRARRPQLLLVRACARWL